MNIKKSIINPLITLGLLTIAFTVALVANYAYGQWTNPGGTPPSANAPAPVNVSSALQIKTGALTTHGFVNWGEVYIRGSARRLVIGASPIADEKLTVMGHAYVNLQVRANNYCDRDGMNCFDGTDITNLVNLSKFIDTSGNPTLKLFQYNYKVSNTTAGKAYPSSSFVDNTNTSYDLDFKRKWNQEIYNPTLAAGQAKGWTSTEINRFTNQCRVESGEVNPMQNVSLDKRDEYRKWCSAKICQLNPDFPEKNTSYSDVFFCLGGGNCSRGTFEVTCVY